MSITVVNSFGDQNNCNPINGVLQSFTNTDGTSMFVMVLVEESIPISSLTYGGIPFVIDTNNSNSVYTGHITNPPTGVNNLSIALSNYVSDGAEFAWNIVSVKGENTSYIYDYNFASGHISAPSGTFTSNVASRANNYTICMSLANEGYGYGEFDRILNGTIHNASLSALASTTYYTELTSYMFSGSLGYHANTSLMLQWLPVYTVSGLYVDTAMWSLSPKEVSRESAFFGLLR